MSHSPETVGSDSYPVPPLMHKCIRKMAVQYKKIPKEIQSDGKAELSIREVLGLERILNAY